jgi:hypothetical protein
LIVIGHGCFRSVIGLMGHFHLHYRAWPPPVSFHIQARFCPHAKVTCDKGVLPRSLKRSALEGNITL